VWLSGVVCSCVKVFSSTFRLHWSDVARHTSTTCHVEQLWSWAIMATSGSVQHTATMRVLQIQSQAAVDLYRTLRYWYSAVLWGTAGTVLFCEVPPVQCCFAVHNNIHIMLHITSRSPLTSTWPYLRCDVGLEEGEYWKKSVSVFVYYYNGAQR